jgi:hypothetical protein
MFDQGLTVAFWSRRHTDRLLPVDEMIGRSLDACAKAEIYRILRKPSPGPVGPEFIPKRDAT